MKVYLYSHPRRVLVLALILALGCTTEPLQPERSGTNFLVVSFDALRADALGAYGYPHRTSPNIDTFAEKAIVFERAYSAAPITPTSFAAIWTGQLPHRVFRRWKFVPTTTIGEVFAAGGYQTAAFVNNVNLTEKRNFGQGFGDYRWFRRIPDEELLEKGTAWLARHSHENFFFWLHFNSPHAPYDYREVAAHLYNSSYKGRFEKTTGSRFETHDPLEVERLRSLYDGEVFFADILFGRLLAEVRNLGLAENTVVVLTSDHGEEFKEHGGFQHKFLHEETLRIPLVLFQPDLPRGRRVSDAVGHVDLFPTLADMAGLQVPPGLDGVSIHGSVAENRLVVSQAITSPEYLAIAAWRNGQKLVVNCKPERSLEYYDLARDPLEQHNRLGVTSGLARKTLSELRKLLGGHLCSELRNGTRGGNPTDDLTPQSIEALRALGYVE